MSYKPEWMKDAENNETVETGTVVIKKVILSVDPSEVIDLSMVEATSIEILDDNKDTKPFPGFTTARVAGITEDQDRILFELSVPIEECISEDILSDLISGHEAEEQNTDEDVGTPWIKSFKVLGFQEGLMGIEIEYFME